MEKRDQNKTVPNEEEERKFLEQIAKRQKGKPVRRERRGAHSWRQWVDDDDDGD